MIHCVCLLYRHGIYIRVANKKCISASFATEPAHLHDSDAGTVSASAP